MTVESPEPMSTPVAQESSPEVSKKEKKKKKAMEMGKSGTGVSAIKSH